MNARMMFTAIAAAILSGCASGPKVDNTPVATLDLNRYLGEWYEIITCPEIGSDGFSLEIPELKDCLRKVKRFAICIPVRTRCREKSHIQG